MLDAALVSHVVKDPIALTRLQQAGITADDFDPYYREVWRFLTRIRQSKGTIPSKRVVQDRFPDIEWVTPSKRDFPLLIEGIKQRRKWQEFIGIIEGAALAANNGFENVDDAIQEAQRAINQLSNAGTDAHIVDLFSSEATKKMISQIRKRALGMELGIPTGLNRIDVQTGGMVKGRMIVVVGRPGLGKSWLDLLFCASAVINGSKFILYPLEMTLEETAFRLYTIFSQKMFGAKKVIRNNDLMMGHVSKRKIVRFLHALEDQFHGQLYVADVGSLSDPYTNERIEADVQVYQPDGFWVDYITLMKAPEQKKGGEDYSAVRYLSSGIKGTAVRRNVVGGSSAQINREALRVRSFIPRLEHIAYGDSIGQDADQVVSINRRGEYLYYAMVKNRHGPEIGTTRVRFNVDIGQIEETKEQGEEDED